MKHSIIPAFVVFLACVNAFPQEAPLSPPRVVVGDNLMSAEASVGNVLPEANPFRDFLQRLKAALETRDMVAVQALYQTNGSSAQELKDELGRWQPMLEEDAGHRVSIQERGCVFRDFRKSSKVWKNFAERVTTHKATHLVRLNTTKGSWLLPLVDLEGTLFIVPANKSKDTGLRREDVQQDGAADRSQPVRPEIDSTPAAAGSCR